MCVCMYSCHAIITVAFWSKLAFFERFFTPDYTQISTTVSLQLITSNKWVYLVLLYNIVMWPLSVFFLSDCRRSKFAYMYSKFVNWSADVLFSHLIDVDMVQ